ncbi:MAG: hypothetical protein ABW049_06015 [Spongiibacteraceae bacterium]
MTASGCGVHVKAYGELLKHDDAYRTKAQAVTAKTLDIAEILLAEEEALRQKLAAANPRSSHGPVAFHSPCTLQHGQRIRGTVERLLTAAVLS